MLDKPLVSTLGRFVGIFSILLIVSCGVAKKKQHYTQVHTKNEVVKDSLQQDVFVEDYIKPYRTQVEEKMNKVLAYNPQDMLKNRNDKSANTKIGNFMADAVYKVIDSILIKEYGKGADFSMLNWGGIRSSLPKGNITTSSIYSLMPFNNKVVVLTMSGKKVQELVDFLIKSRMPHPISAQVRLHWCGNSGKIKEFSIKGQPFDVNKKYVVITSDYLLNGGDAMYFFGDAEDICETNYLLRDTLFEYIRGKREIQVEKDERLVIR